MSKLIKTITDFKKSLNGQTVSIHGKEYATVALRLGVARRNLGTSLDIVTKVIHHDDKQILMQADIFIDGKHVSTGTAHEFRAESKMHQTSYVELCDTSCIGRALAMTGLINDSVASAEEVSLAREQSDKKLQQALSELETISHEGAYKQWLTAYQVTFNNLKINDPLAYSRFLEKFTLAKNNLTNKGVLKNVGQ
jgi:dihydroxyacetone kinase DhaKLM complex PTS-EIIA-like component DhaM